MSRRSDMARIALGLIRLVNGGLGLFAPSFITRRFTTDGNAEPPPAAVYGLRMFGIRTILVAFDLLRPDGPDRRHAMRVAPIIHASDTVTAVLIARSGRIPRNSGLLLVSISAVNTLLALLMQKGERRVAEHATE